eukprot:jgi/Hompol1/6053/HPOL_000265-RA
MQIVQALGGTLVDSWAECTHLVTDKVRRTVKFLCALSAGRHIIDIKWLEASKKEGRFADPSKFMLKDAKTEKMYGFTLRKSLLSVRKPGARPIFSDCTFYATPTVLPCYNDLKEILSAAGGTLIQKRTSINSDTIIIGNEKDASECAGLRDRGHTIYSTELVLTGILRQELDLQNS